MDMLVHELHQRMSCRMEDEDRTHHEAQSMKRLLGILLLLVLIPACSFTPTYRGTVKVGVAVPLSGDLADGGDSVEKGVRLQAERINKSGGLLGYKIEVIAKDDAADTDTALQVAEELVKEGVVMVVGHYNSGQSIPASAIYNRAKIIMITPTSSHPDLTRQNFPYVFRVNPTDEAQGPQLARFAIQKLGKTRIAIIHDETDYAKGLRDEFIKEAQHLGVTPVIVELAPSGQDDYTPVLNRVKAANPDLLFAAIDYPQAEVLLIQKRQVGLTADFLAGDAVFQYEVILTTGSASEGIYVSSFVPSIRGLERADAKEFMKTYREMFNRNPGPDSVPGALALEVWARAVKAANSFAPDAVAAAIKKLQFIAPITNIPIAYDNKGDLVTQVIYINQVRNGQFVAVETR
jgi:branched-chain amino acid transport system substrate-binding protein